MPALDRAQVLTGLLFGLLVAAATSASGCATVLDMDRDPPIVGTPDFASSPMLGSNDGLAFAPVEVIVSHDQGLDGASGFRILATDRLGLCDRITDVIALEPGEKVLSMLLQVDNLAIGQYRLGGVLPPLATATFVRTPSTCSAALDRISGSGVLDIVSTSDGVEGVVDLTFPDGHARGRFTARACDVVSGRIIQCGPR
jgi:hypothetical protein